MISNSAARNLLKSLYDVDAELTRLYGELDDNFLAVTAGGEKRVLKIMHEGCDSRRVDFQCRAMSHLATTASELNLPQVIPASNGLAYNESRIDGASRLIWLLKYCPGTLLADVTPHTNYLLRSFGRMMALLDVGLESFTHPAMKQGHKWQLTRAAAVRPFVKYIANDAAPQVDETLGHFESDTLEKLIGLRQSVIHNDAHTDNVLVNAGEGGREVVDGLIDFGDMSYQPTVCEAAIALAYVSIGKDDPIRACAAFLAAYTEIYPLSEAEIGVLYDLIMTRLAVTIAITFERRHEDPDDQLGQQEIRPVIHTLSRLGTLSRGAAESLFRQGCGISLSRTN
jgi:Ser/Thr protein kinase RdoA (MazF antagonist)